MAERELVLIVAEGCSYCEQVEALSKDDRIRILDATKDLEGTKILRDLEIFRVPLLVALEKTRQGVQACAVEDKEGVGRAKNIG